MAGWKIPYSNNGALVRWENHRTIAGWFSGASLIAALAAPGAGRRWFITNTSIPQNGQHGPPRNENWTLGWWFFSCLDLVIWCHSGAHPVYIILMSWNLCLLATGMLRIEHDWTNNQNWRNLHSDLRHHWQKRQNQHTFWMFWLPWLGRQNSPWTLWIPVALPSCFWNFLVAVAHFLQKVLL